MPGLDAPMEDKKVCRVRHEQRPQPMRKLLFGLAAIGLMLYGSGPSLTLAQDAEELFSPFTVAAKTPLSAPTPAAPPAGQPESPTTIGYPDTVKTALLLIKRGQYSSAIGLLEPLREQDDFLTLHALGVAYVRTKRNQEAYHTLLRAHQLRPAIAAPLLPAALACARMAKRCDDYRRLALEYKALGGKFTRFADKIANHLPITLTFTRRS
jgi:hypothetical protein